MSLSIWDIEEKIEHRLDKMREGRAEKEKEDNEITTEREAYYLEHSCRCPFCNSKDIEGQGFEQEKGNEVSRWLVCLDCDRSWTEIYKLSGIVGDD
jgi:transposase-like protein